MPSRWIVGRVCRKPIAMGMTEHLVAVTGRTASHIQSVHLQPFGHFSSSVHNFLRATMSTKKAKNPLVILGFRAFWRKGRAPSQQFFDGLCGHLFADGATGIIY